MFDIDNEEKIIKLIETRECSECVIPLYVKTHQGLYSILELDDITDFCPSTFKVGFGTVSGLFIKNGFPDKYAFDFDTVKVFRRFSNEYNSDIRYVIFESGFVDQVSPLHECIDKYYSVLSEYVEKSVKKIKSEMIRKHMEENM